MNNDPNLSSYTYKSKLPNNLVQVPLSPISNTPILFISKCGSPN